MDVLVVATEHLPPFLLWSGLAWPQLEVSAVVALVCSSSTLEPPDLLGPEAWSSLHQGQELVSITAADFYLGSFLVQAASFLLLPSFNYS